MRAERFWQLLVLLSLLPWVFRFARNRQRIKSYERGRKLLSKPRSQHSSSGLRFGPFSLPPEAATQHFLVAGTTGSGKSLIQRYLMADVVSRFRKGLDSRALIFDAKGDSAAFLKQANVGVPIYSFNPFESKTSFPTSVRWDIAADITSIARAQNLGSTLIPEERSGGNRYFTDAGRQVVIGLVESLIRHSPGEWNFTDLVTASLRQDHIEEVLRRDRTGQAVLDSFFGDDRTAYQVFTTVVSRMSYYRPVAGLWQRAERTLSIREWLTDDSILLLGSDATSTMALNAINEVIFRVLTEEIDSQTNSTRRRTWVWIDEARLAGPLLRNELLPFLAVKGRSRGAALVLGFQDINGMREAAGERIANELVAQCSHKALLRMESEESASWASRLIGQYETIERFESDSTLGSNKTVNEQRVQKDAVLASQFFEIPVTSRRHGLTGYFVSPVVGATKATICPKRLSTVVVPEILEEECAIRRRAEAEQEMNEWSETDRIRLDLALAVTGVEQRTSQLRLRKRIEQSTRNIADS